MRKQKSEDSQRHVPFKKMLIWEKAVQIAKLTYKITKEFPKEEQFGLTNQMRRASVSVASNIAEGSQRTTKKDFAHFLMIAKGSLAELETQRVISCELGYIQKEETDMLEAQIEEGSKMIYVFYSKLTSNL